MNRTATISALTVSLALGACRGQPSEEPPVLLLRNMFHQQRYNPQSIGNQFGDHRTMRTPPAGTVTRENFLDDERVSHGVETDGTTYVPTIPADVLAAFGGGEQLVERGHERFNIYCAPCHGRMGDGQGLVFLRSRVTGYSYPPPPTFLNDRVKHLPDGQLFATISNGKGNMPSYGAQIPVNDRWAIVSYVRALELTQSNSTGAAQ